MATTAYLENAGTPASLRLSQLSSNRSSEAGFLQGMLFATMGTALGLLAGTAAAIGPWGTNRPMIANDSPQISANAVTVSSSADQHALRSQSIQNQLNRLATEPAVPVLVLASLDTSVAHHTAAAPLHRASVNPFANNVSGHATKAVAKSSEPAAPVAPGADSMSVASVPATPDNASKPAPMMIEGDLTVADFNASTGTVETREGRNFSVNQAGSDGNTLAWQDYAGNVHYRCTQAGSCMLKGSGVAASATMI
jgi:hypothetical protein